MEPVADGNIGRDPPDLIETVPNMEPITDHEIGDEYKDCLEPKYELRPQSRNLKYRHTTWIDQDDTGDYDPGEELRKQRANRIRARLRSQKAHEHRSDGGGLDSAEDGTAGRDGQQLIARITFSSLTSKAEFKKCVKKSHVTGESKHNNLLLNEYILRLPHSGTSTQPEGEGRPHIPNLSDDLTGHPIARGCWECVSLGQRCPLLDDEHAWPCTNCIVDEHDCDLITPPEVKQACERCKRWETECSFTLTTDHGTTCEKCEDDGYRCVAGPAYGTIRARIRYDGDYTRVAAPPTAEKPREIWTCMQCREAGRQCSFSTGGYGDDCAACEEKGNICFPERTMSMLPTPLSSGRKNQNGVKRHQTIEHQPSTPSKRAKSVASRPYTITTRFHHPILFNHDDPSSTQSCDFCFPSAHGLLGLKSREVQVTAALDGSGTIHELNPIDTKREATRMCLPCTMERAAICMCPAHILRPIPGLNPGKLDYDGALTAVFESRRLRKGERWCCVCLDLATWDCAAVSEGEEDEGCGLLLCELCANGARKEGGCEGLLGRIKWEDRPLGLRADHELLKREGWLMRFVVWASQR